MSNITSDISTAPTVRIVRKSKRYVRPHAHSFFANLNSARYLKGLKPVMFFTMYNAPRGNNMVLIWEED